MEINVSYYNQLPVSFRPRRGEGLKLIGSADNHSIDFNDKPRHRGLGEERTTFCYTLSEGRKINSRCQLNPAIALRSKREEFGLETKQAQARKRPQRRAGGRSK